MLNSKALTL